MIQNIDCQHPTPQKVKSRFLRYIFTWLCTALCIEYLW